MPQYKFGNMFEHMNDYDLFLVTANSFVKKDNSLVLGRGAALQLKDRYPAIAYEFGMAVLDICGHLGEYNLIYNSRFGILQVKYHFKSQADLLLIQRSCDVLKDRAKLWKNKKICVNYPGIGAGRVSKALVEMFVDMLPNNVDVWRYKED